MWTISEQLSRGSSDDSYGVLKTLKHFFKYQNIKYGNRHPGDSRGGECKGDNLIIGWKWWKAANRMSRV